MIFCVVLVIGGIGGIGIVICQCLVDQGYWVVINYCDQVKVDVWWEMMLVCGCDVVFFCGDVFNLDMAEVMVQLVEVVLGLVEIFINNVGIICDIIFYCMCVEQWYDVININFNLVFNVICLVIEGMCCWGWGWVIQISLINGLKGQYGQVNYVVVKVGMYGFIILLVCENVGFGIIVNIILFGYVVIDMVMVVLDEVCVKIIVDILIGCFGKFEEIVYVVVFLVVEEVVWIIGLNLDINGGYYMGW